MVYPGGPENMDVSGQVLTEDQAQLELAEEAPDTYGGKKLKCEALLQQALASHGFFSAFEAVVFRVFMQGQWDAILSSYKYPVELQY